MGGGLGRGGARVTDFFLLRIGIDNIFFSFFWLGEG